MDQFILSKEERESFVENGFLGPFKVYDQDEAKEIGKKIRVQTQNKEHAPFPESDINYDRHIDVPLLTRHISHPAIVRRLQSLIGPDVFCWRSEFFPKYPGDLGTEWHQVETYAYTTGTPHLEPTTRREKTPTELTVWTAFTDVPVETGPLKFMPGSHKKWNFNEKQVMKKFDGLNTNGSFFGYHFDELKLDPDWKADESKARVMTMKAGEAVVFTARCMHGSLDNTSKRAMRLAVATRYVPTDVKIYPYEKSFKEHGQSFDLAKWGAVLVGGQDDYHLNKIITQNAFGEPFTTLPRIEGMTTAKICAGDQWASG